jgi:hypothetical protein
VAGQYLASWWRHLQDYPEDRDLLARKAAKAKKEAADKQAASRPKTLNDEEVSGSGQLQLSDVHVPEPALVTWKLLTNLIVMSLYLT